MSPAFNLLDESSGKFDGRCRRLTASGRVDGKA
jgi:hypothetical protein